jgi:HPt (histidine-containing phosphotransfer) domain-containing protein
MNDLEATNAKAAGLEKLVAAAQRLEQAVIRLQEAARHIDTPASRPDLAIELARAKADYTALAQATATAGSRLEMALGRLDRIVGR